MTQLYTFSKAVNVIADIIVDDLVDDISLG